MPSGFNLPNQYDSIKYLTMDKKERKNNAQETESEDKLPRVNPSEQGGLKHILVAVDADQGWEGGYYDIFIHT